MRHSVQSKARHQLRTFTGSNARPVPFKESMRAANSVRASVSRTLNFFFYEHRIRPTMADIPPSSGPASTASSQSPGNASSSAGGATGAAAKAAPKQNPAFAAMGTLFHARRFFMMMNTKLTDCSQACHASDSPLATG